MIGDKTYPVVLLEFILLVLINSSEESSKFKTALVITSAHPFAHLSALFPPNNSFEISGSVSLTVCSFSFSIIEFLKTNISFSFLQVYVFFSEVTYTVNPSYAALLSIILCNSDKSATTVLASTGFSLNNLNGAVILTPFFSLIFAIINT